MDEMVGIFEIAQMASVSNSAVSNWRLRFSDFPEPAFELKAGPVFRKPLIARWLEKRREDVSLGTSFYDELAAKRGDATELRNSIQETVSQLVAVGTSDQKPGILLGKIQSGKTRAFLGIIAKAFDEGYGIAVIVTKGTKSLAQQTLSRVHEDFEEFIDADQVLAFDIMNLRELTPYDLSHKLILVAKKEDDNLDRLLKAFGEDYPALKDKRLLIIDDEADLCSVSANTKHGLTRVGVVASQIDRLRTMVSECSFLQVTATPYALYLQPNEAAVDDANTLVLPKRPAFTVLLPVHKDYVGGDHYFDSSNDPTAPGFHFFREVPIAELDALKKPDGRRLKIEDVLHERNAAMLRNAIVTFLVGGTVRRLQQEAEAKKKEKYSFLFHTEQSRASHTWQQQVAETIRKQLVAEAEQKTPEFYGLISVAYRDIERSVLAAQRMMPALQDVTRAVADALTSGQLKVTRVNSDAEIQQLLDKAGQLHLSNPFNIFIGGQILDRGITIKNLIGTYYGRNPRKFQQDTVLQHSRMYGARSKADLDVTRFFAPDHIYKVMRKINDFDCALREALANPKNSRGVHFIQRDPAGQITPCAKNKLLFSKMTSIRPGRRMVLAGFETLSVSAGTKLSRDADRAIDAVCGRNQAEPLLINLDVASRLLQKVYACLDLSSDERVEANATAAAMEQFSKSTTDNLHYGKVWIMTASDRNTVRIRESGRPSDAPDTKQQTDKAKSHAKDIPVLMLFRQNGEREEGWKGLPFWWPVLLTPSQAASVICADDDAK